jgi:hypothetical protein
MHQTSSEMFSFCFCFLALPCHTSASARELRLRVQHSTAALFPNLAGPARVRAGGLSSRVCFAWLQMMRRRAAGAAAVPARGYVRFSATVAREVCRFRKG